MTNNKNAFIELAIRCEVLRFGEFTLKSGRMSPYFFNAGQFYSSEAIAQLGDMYAQTIVSSKIKFDVLYGPAYKGIPLAAVTAASLYRNHQININWTYNRKEAKTHGEGGSLVGAPLQGRVLIIDDVITAGTAINESIALIGTEDAEFAGVIIALDRQEKAESGKSAIEDIKSKYKVPILHIACLDDMIAYLDQRAGFADELDAIKCYRKQFGTAM